MQRIWTYKDNESLPDNETTLDLKNFKTTGRFYDDIDNLAGLMKIKVHPALKPQVYSAPGENGDQQPNQS